MTKSRGINAPSYRWTEADVEILKRRYANERTESIANDLGLKIQSVYTKAKSLGLKKSREYLCSPAACRLDGITGSSSRFQKGQSAWNKGMKGLQTGGQAGWFKPGYRGGRALEKYQPIGTIRVSKDGYLQKKIHDGMPLQSRWRGVHLVNWEAVHGPVNTKTNALCFKDGNKENCAIENLELVTRADLARRNMVLAISPEVRKVMQLRGAITRQINKRKQNEQQQ
jgi:hypothetical protein